MHLNALYDLQKHTYSDVLIQPVHQKDEFGPSVTWQTAMSQCLRTKDVFIGDRGYCFYNNMAHVIEKGCIFCFVPKTSIPKALLEILIFLIQIPFDIRVHVTLVRSHRKASQSKKAFTNFCGCCRIL